MTPRLRAAIEAFTQHAERTHRYVWRERDGSTRTEEDYRPPDSATFILPGGYRAIRELAAALAEYDAHANGWRPIETAPLGCEPVFDALVARLRRRNGDGDNRVIQPDVLADQAAAAITALVRERDEARADAKFLRDSADDILAAAIAEARTAALREAAAILAQSEPQQESNQ